MIFGTAATAERSSSKNLEVIREELKRQVISWLLEEVPFAGRPAMKPAGQEAVNSGAEGNQSGVIRSKDVIAFESAPKFAKLFDLPRSAWTLLRVQPGGSGRMHTTSVDVGTDWASASSGCRAWQSKLLTRSAVAGVALLSREFARAMASRNAVTKTPAQAPTRRALQR